MAGIQRGTIVWAEISDKERRSESKERPALVISQNEKIAAGSDLIVAVISTKFSFPPPACWFVLPTDPFGDDLTGLNQPSVVKADWVEIVPQEKVLRVMGRAKASLCKSVISWIKNDAEKRKGR